MGNQEQIYTKRKLSRKDISRSTAPITCYALEKLPKKSGSATLYRDLRTAVKDGKATLVTKLEIPPCDARSWRVPAGYLFRIICSHGPQVCWLALGQLEQSNHSLLEVSAHQIQCVN